MRRRTSFTAVVSLGAVWAMSACGIPTDKDPEVIGDAPTDFDASSGAAPETFEPTLVAEETVGNFLKAVSGDPDSRDDRLNLFTVSGEEHFSEPSEGIRLVADLAIEPVHDANDLDSATVTVTGSVVGTYLEDGSVRMNATPADYDETFTLQREDIQEVWKMNSLPMQVALDYDYFSECVRAGADVLPGRAGRAPRPRPALDLPTSSTPRPASACSSNGSSSAPPSSPASRRATRSRPAPSASSRPRTAPSRSTSRSARPSTTRPPRPLPRRSSGASASTAISCSPRMARPGPRARRRDWRELERHPAWTCPRPRTSSPTARCGSTRADQRVTQNSPEHPWVGFQRRRPAAGRGRARGDQIAAVVAGSGGDVLQTGANASTMRAVTGPQRGPRRPAVARRRHRARHRRRRADPGHPAHRGDADAGPGGPGDRDGARGGRSAPGLCRGRFRLGGPAGPGRGREPHRGRCRAGSARTSRT